VGREETHFAEQGSCGDVLVKLGEADPPALEQVQPIGGLSLLEEDVAFASLLGRHERDEGVDCLVVTRLVHRSDQCP
jgi:hypothetical protein